MKYAFRAKIFLALVIAALVSASIAFLLDSPTLKRAPAPTKEIKQEQAEVMIDGFRFAKTDEGKDNWELVAKTAEVEKDTGSAKLHDLEATFNAKGGMVMKLKADHGTFDSSTKAVSVGSAGNPVTVESNSGYKMSFQDMSWDDNRQELSTKKGVTLTGKNIKIEGKGMVARTDMQKILITDGVKTTFSQ